MRLSTTLVMPDPLGREEMKMTSIQDGLRKLQGWVLLGGRNPVGWRSPLRSLLRIEKRRKRIQFMSKFPSFMLNLLKYSYPVKNRMKLPRRSVKPNH